MNQLCRTGFAALILAAGSSAFAADPQLMNLVMPNARALSGLNATAARISPLGQFILSKAPGTNQQFQDFVSTTGFDPRQDVAEVLAASVGDPSAPGGLLLVRGTFQPDRVTAALSAKPGVTSETYAGTTLFSFADAKKKLPQGLAFLGGNIAVAGDLSSVKAALDRSSGTSSIDPALAVKINTLSGANDAWFVSNVPVSAVAGNAPKGLPAPVLPALQSIQSSSGGVKLGANVQISAEAVASDAQNAASLAAVLQLARMLAASNPQLASALPFLQQMQVTTNGNAVDVALSVPEALIEQALTNAPKHQASARTAPRAQSQPSKN